MGRNGLTGFLATTQAAVSWSFGVFSFLEFSLSPSQFLAPGGKGERVEIRSRSNDGTAGDQCDRIMEGRLVAVTLSCTIPGCLGSVSRC